MSLPHRLRIPALLAFVVASAGFSVARAEIEFVGIIATPQQSLFALADTVTGRIDWLVAGKIFSGYTIASFDAQSDTLTLHQDASEKRLRLKDDAKIKAARLELTGKLSFGTKDKVEFTRVMMFYDQEAVFPLKDGVVCRLTPRRVPDGSIQYDFAFERHLAENKTETLSASALRALPGREFAIQIGDLGFAFDPRPN